MTRQSRGSPTSQMRLGCSSGEPPPPPLARPSGGSSFLPKLGKGGLFRGSSRDCASLQPAPSVEGSEEPLAVTRSPLSGSSKAPFPPDRSFQNDFQWTLLSRDLPLDVRPIIEDNKMLQEELRRYRQRVGEQEGLLAAKDRQMASLRDELARERQRLKECQQAVGVSPEQLLQDQQFRRALEERDASLKALQQKAGILEKAKAAAERRLTNDLAAERRVQGELRQQIRQLQDEMAEKQKQSRFNQLHINQLYKRLEPLEAAVVAAAAPKEPPPPPPPAEEKVSLMLCMVYAQPAPTAAEIAEAAARLAAQEAARAAAELRQRQEPAALRIQAAFRGHAARRRLAAFQAAATLIQAAGRGMLARRAAADLRQQRQAELERLEAASMSPALRLSMRRQAAEQQYKERLAGRSASMRRGSAAGAAQGGRAANTAVEAAARQRGQSPVGGASANGGHQSSGLTRRPSGIRGGAAATAGGSQPGGAAGRHGVRGSISGASPAGGRGREGAPGAAGAESSGRGSSAAGGAATVGRPSHAPAAGPVPALDLGSKAAKQGRASARQGAGSGRNSLQHGEGQEWGGTEPGGLPQKKRSSVNLGFSSSQARSSILEGAS